MLYKNAEISNRKLIAANRIFASGILAKIAKKSDFSEFMALSNQVGFEPLHGQETTVAHAFNYAFEQLRKSGVRSEYVYKSALTHNVLLGIHSLSTASMATEFRAGNSKADLVIFNGTSTAYEIKSDRDNLSRLLSQIADYRKTFARNFVICSTNHVDDVEKLLPEDVGILLLSRWNRISTVREASESTSSLCLRTMFSSLTSDEISKILAAIGEETPQVPNTRLRNAMWEVVAGLDKVVVHRAMVATLRKTRSRQSIENTLRKFPKSVMPAVMTMRLRRAEQENLAEAMNKPFASL